MYHASPCQSKAWPAYGTYISREPFTRCARVQKYVDLCKAFAYIGSSSNTYLLLSISLRRTRAHRILRYHLIKDKITGRRCVCENLPYKLHKKYGAKTSTKKIHGNRKIQKSARKKVFLHITCCGMCEDIKFTANHGTKIRW